MSNYLVDGSDLTSVANAIRAKSGGSGQLAFPAGFVSEIQAIPSGSTWALDDFIAKTYPNGETTITKSSLWGTTLSGYSAMTKINLLGRFTAPKNFLSNCANLVEIYAPKVTIGGSSYLANNSKKVKKIVVGSGDTRLGLSIEYGVLETVDILWGAFSTSEVLERNTKLKTLILRRGTVGALSSVGVFDRTPFASGGTGGTIYIPEVLYDHLGDGTADDYLAATNWSTLNGYGTVTWAKIEGSVYENKYADGHDIIYASVVQNLTNCTSSNNAAFVSLGSRFETTLTADSGYTLSSVTVTRGGTDITSSSYDSTTGVVKVGLCYNDVIITATAT